MGIVGNRFLSSQPCRFLSSRIPLLRIQGLRMNGHRGSDGDRLLRPEANRLVDDSLAAAPEKETRGLAVPGLHPLPYPLVPRSEGTLVCSELNPGGFLPLEQARTGPKIGLIAAAGMWPSG